jgi:hypothetical protein
MLQLCEKPIFLSAELWKSVTHACVLLPPAPPAVRAAKEATGCHATAIYVPPPGAAKVRACFVAAVFFDSWGCLAASPVHACRLQSVLNRWNRF